MKTAMNRQAKYPGYGVKILQNCYAWTCVGPQGEAAVALTREGALVAYALRSMAK